jgi:hypothetical protein
MSPRRTFLGAASLLPFMNPLRAWALEKQKAPPPNPTRLPSPPMQTTYPVCRPRGRAMSRLPCCFTQEPGSRSW